MNHFIKLIVALALFAAPVAVQAQEIEESPATEEASCKTSIFIRASTGSTLVFPTWACWKFYPVAAASYNPDTGYYEFPLIGIGTDIVSNDGTKALGLFATYANAEDAQYLEWFAGPSLSAGNLSLVAFFVGYVPLEEKGVWQHGLDFARLSYDIGPVSPGVTYTNFYVEGGKLEQRLGPALAIETSIGEVQIDALLNVANTDDELRVGYGFSF